MCWDVFDAYAEKVLPDMIAIYESYVHDVIVQVKDIMKGRSLISILRAWDYRQDKESSAAAIFNTWERAYLRNLLENFDENADRRYLITTH